MWFRRLGVVTIVTVYLLILAGGIVRSTGSGMGCPDWPKCFGSWVPPTNQSQLPLNYQQIYGARLKGEVVFNALKTWIEYVNRLLGAVTGLLIFGTLLASVPFLKKDRLVFYLSLLAFLLVGFQGWLGSKVVSSELHPGMVTLHMIVAILIVFVLLYALTRSYAEFVRVERITANSSLRGLLVFTMVLTLGQVVLGTQVRQSVDEVVHRLSGLNRATWIDQLGLSFYVHRSFSLVVLGMHGYLIYRLKRATTSRGRIYNYASALAALVVLEIATGVVMAYFAIPAFLQPVHLTLAVVISGIQFVTLLLLNRAWILGKTHSVAEPVANPIH